MTHVRRTLCLAGVACAALLCGRSEVAAQSGYPSGYQASAPRLSGTFQLDRTRSDDPQAIADAATRRLPWNDRDRVRQALLARLNPPDTLAIDRTGHSVTIESTRGRRMTFDADGRPHTEQAPSGRMVTTRADLLGERLTVSMMGNSGSDYTVTFEPERDGDLRVTRSLGSEDLATPVLLRSVYRRTVTEPRWDVYDAGRPLVVPEGTRLVATLDRDLDTRTSHEGERFTLTTRGPGPYRGAVITGVLARVIGRSGGANMMFDFASIRLPNGRAADIDGELESVRTPNGELVRVERSGALREGNRSNATVQQGAVGAALGAIIGAIAGGGKGAAIGAVVGGAGTVILEGNDRLSLPIGTEFTVLVVRPR